MQRQWLGHEGSGTHKAKELSCPRQRQWKCNAKAVAWPQRQWKRKANAVSYQEQDGAAGVQGASAIRVPPPPPSAEARTGALSRLSAAAAVRESGYMLLRGAGELGS